MSRSTSWSWLIRASSLCPTVSTITASRGSELPTGAGLRLLLGRGLPRRGPQAQRGGDRERDDDDAERDHDRDLRGPLDVLPAVDERELVLVHGVQHELHADER